MKTSSGPALRLLSIPLIIGLLTSCGQQSAPQKTKARPAPVRTAKDDVEEVEALVAAVKQHPSLVDPKKNAGLTLTESYAMWPAAAVSGFYFAHPKAAYFGVGKIERDQVEDYARRKNMPLNEIERWLAPNLNYDPGTPASDELRVVLRVSPGQ